MVVGRDLADVRVRDLDVVAEDLVETDLQARDACAGDLVGLETGDPLLAAAGNGVQLVQFRVVATPNDAALPRTERRLINQGRVERFTQVGAKFEASLQAAEQRRMA